MDKRTGDLHLRVVLAGEPSRVRSAFNSRFVPYAERASIKHHWRLRFTKRSRYFSSGVIALRDEVSGIVRHAAAAREAVVRVGAETVLGDLADDWVKNGRRMNYTPWASFFDANDHWLNLVELDFLEANLDQYRELRMKSLEEEQRYRADWAFPFQVRIGEDDNATESPTD